MTKKLITITSMAILLIMAGGLASCESTGDVEHDSDLIESVLPNEGIAAFFEQHLPSFSGFISELFFVGQNGNRVIVINSMNELRRHVSSTSVELPDIDFNSYTLIIGQQQMSGTGYRLIDQSLVVGSRMLELTLTVEVPEGSFTIICPLYFWGLFPKLPRRSINVNVVFIPTYH